jgi:CheY-like chemotaxis protein
LEYGSGDSQKIDIDCSSPERGDLEKTEMGSKILLADDSITIQKVVNLTFADEGIEVVSVSNGDLAERRLHEVAPDLVLADIFMPGKNGYELCEAIKQDAQFRDIPVVLLVGAFEPFNESEARRVRADAHLTKPFESRVLVETVKSLIERSPKRKAMPQAEVAQQVAAPEPPPVANARPMAMPDIDLSAMSNPFPPQESVFADRVSASGFGDATPFADSFPNNFDYSQNQPQAAVDFSMDVSPLPAANAQPANPQETDLFSTFEPLPQPPASDNTFQVTEVLAPPQDAGTVTEVFGSPVISNSAAVAPSHNFDVLEPFAGQAEAPALAESPVETQVLESNDSQSGDVVVDFEKLDAIQEPTAQELPSFEVDLMQPSASPVQEAPIPEAPQAAVQETRNMEVQAAQKFKTNDLESPVESAFIPTLRDTEYGSNGNGAGEASQANTDFAFYQSSATQEPSLLSTDEPLGDVFNDFLRPDAEPLPEAAPMEFAEPSVAAQQPQTPEVVAPAVNEAVTEPAYSEPDVFSSFVSGAEVLPVAETASEVAIAEAPVQDFSFVAPVTEPSQPEAPVSSNSFEVVIPPKAEPIQIETTAPADTQFNFYTEPQGEEAPKVAAAEVNHQQVLAEPAASPEAPVQQEKFTASDMWEAEAQFTPVAIESLPVAELPTATAQETADQQAEVVAAPVAPFESSSPNLSAPLEVAPHTDENHLEKTTPKEVEMNKEMMDEIVRQVVAQLSDSVVREIAWEVVPDCVERVVTNLTKQDLVKRL